jgi:outer membrane protein OmpA-like peptidoglycan-associated protein
MNTIYKTILTVSGALVTIGGVAQEKEITKVNDSFNQYEYADAISSYEELLKKGFTEAEIYSNLAQANYRNANYTASSDWYEKLYELKGDGMSSDELYYYAQSLKSSERYAESAVLMQQLKEDGRLAKYVGSKDYLSQIEKNSGRYAVKNLLINSKESDYAPAFFADKLVFTTARDTGFAQNSIHKWNNKSFSNFYQASLNANGEFVEAASFSKALNSKAHESSMVFTKDGKTVYFTRNNDSRGNFSRDKAGVSRLKLYRGEYEDGNWASITELPFNSDDYSVAHPALNAGEDKLYFASDMEGSLGASDIFVVAIKSDGSYSEPKNLGASINTEGRETFPFVSQEDVLYFASDGHPGLGGLDVFATDLSSTNSEYTITNVGKPVNSKMDDFSYIINSTTQKGFFASNREGGMGDDDIYGFTEKEKLELEFEFTLEGIVKNLENGDLLPNSIVTILDAEGNEIARATADAAGNFNIPIRSTLKELTTVITLDDFEIGGKTFMPNKDGVSLEFLLAPMNNMVATGEDVGKYLNMPMIYFNFDKSNIRTDAQIELDKIVAFMNQYPDTKIEIGSHTDSRGNDGYNLALSERRAQSTRDYLIQMGIDRSRILAKGYGETKLTNNCGNVIENAVECLESQHDLNRRSEFIIVK